MISFFEFLKISVKPERTALLNDYNLGIYQQYDIKGFTKKGVSFYNSKTKKDFIIENEYIKLFKEPIKEVITRELKKPNINRKRKEMLTRLQSMLIVEVL